MRNSDSSGSIKEEFSDLFKSIEFTPIATIITDARVFDNPIVAVNSAFCALTGYSREEAIGRNCRFLAGKLTESQPRAALANAVLAGKPALVELTNYRKDCSPCRKALIPEAAHISQLDQPRPRDCCKAPDTGSDLLIGVSLCPFDTSFSPERL